MEGTRATVPDTILVRNKETGEFLAEDGTWVRAEAGAAQFPNFLMLMRRCLDLDLKTGEAVLRFKSPQNEIRIPLYC